MRSRDRFEDLSPARRHWREAVLLLRWVMLVVGYDTVPTVADDPHARDSRFAGPLRVLGPLSLGICSTIIDFHGQLNDSTGSRMACHSCDTEDSSPDR